MPDQPRPDPSDLDAVDIEICLNEAEERARERAEGGDSRAIDPQEQFFDFESAPIGTNFDRLTHAGVDLPAPDSLDDWALHAKLWEVIYSLAARCTYLYHTNHLSDRELYTQLWSELLRVEQRLFPPGSGWNNRIDLIGGGSEDDFQIALRYYYTEAEREEWITEFCDDIPPHQDPPYDRDSHLPGDPPPPMIAGQADHADENEHPEESWRGDHHPDEDELWGG